MESKAVFFFFPWLMSTGERVLSMNQQLIFVDGKTDYRNDRGGTLIFRSPIYPP